MHVLNISRSNNLLKNTKSQNKNSKEIQKRVRFSSQLKHKKK